MQKILALLLAFLLISPAWADGTIDTLGAGAALTGTESIPMFQTANPAVKTTPNAIKTFVGLNGLLPYVSGDYYTPWPSTAGSQSQLYATANLYCRVAYFKGLATVDTLGAAIAIVAASGNFQVAIYALDPTTQLPTGNALAKTGSISTAALGGIVAAVNSGTPFQFGSSTSALTGYGFCIMVDATAGGNAAFSATGNGGQGMTDTVGSTTVGGVFNTATTAFGSVQLTATYGTWPSLTAAAFTKNNFGGIVPIFHLSSVP